MTCINKLNELDDLPTDEALKKLYTKLDWSYRRMNFLSDDLRNYYYLKMFEKLIEIKQHILETKKSLKETWSFEEIITELKNLQPYYITRNKQSILCIPC